MGSLRLAVARDEAFCFYYNENLRELERAGFEITGFSPLHDRELPGDTAGLYIGGGYPELHAKTLSKNEGVLVDIKHKADSGMPILAECGGFMYLTEAITDENGKSRKMCGIFDVKCVKTDRLVRFGYVGIFDNTGHWLEPGKGVKGHEFHYYDTVKEGAICTNGSGAKIIKASNGTEYTGIYITDTIWAGWPHLYFRSESAFVEKFYDKCRTYKEHIK